MTSTSEAKGINRREFLYYLLGGSLVLLAAESGAAAYWYAEPQIKFGRELGIFELEVGKLPVPKTRPILFPEGKFWLSITSKGLLALSVSCTRDAALFKWVNVTNRFECPACGAKYQADGICVSVSARDLDRYVIYTKTPNSINQTSSDGSPVNIEGATAIYVDVNHKILGQPRS